MSGTSGQSEDLTLEDHLIEQTDNGPELGVPDPPQEPDWSPLPSPRPAGA